MNHMSSEDLTRFADILEKSAEYIDELEARQQETEKQAGLAVKQPHIDRLKELGFEEDELQKMAGLDPETLTAIEKRASGSNSSTWGMGSGGRPSESDMDPFTRWLTS